MNLETFHSRRDSVRASGRIQKAAQQRVKVVAGELSTSAKWAMRAEIINEAISAIVTLAYEEREGRPVNVDERTGDMLISVPWSSRGYRRYGLRRTERDVLAHYIARLSHAASKGERLPPLFVFDEASRRWFLNRPDYPDIISAGMWLKESEMSPSTWADYERFIKNRRGKQRGTVPQKVRQKVHHSAAGN